MNYAPEEIKKSLQILAGTYNKDELTLELATVTGVDLTAYTCSVTLTSGDSQVNYNNVQLTAELGSDGFILVPKVGSNILIHITTRNEIYMFQCSEIDQVLIYRDNEDGTYHSIQLTTSGIQLEDGSYGGLVRYDNLITLLTQTNKLLSLLLGVINNTVINEPGNGAPSALQQALKAALSGQDVGSLDELDSQYITHGKPL